ncbi:four helix bundle protein [Hymenobacter latericus]|uniref:four helix bundle protein n=1 Tax=Hymenobacter sp. YIM 151858-1 TaxID=2987688 RepID=UPI002226757F|nr:four helix bundle protein [Hymenobacter sp. YIM 151858-1]UYZ58341.1 four helix bundle protein [Hymenobacter sp. YIM 151858-1]
MNNFEFAEQFKARTKAFALRVIRLYKVLPTSAVEQVVGKQLLRAATSTAANYRAACRARSAKEFVAKVGVALEEADESLFWLELLAEAELLPAERLKELQQEAHEIVSVLAKIRKSAHATAERKGGATPTENALTPKLANS